LLGITLGLRSLIQLEMKAGVISFQLLKIAQLATNKSDSLPINIFTQILIGWRYGF
jgi:hypothetical protein